ncbi:MAG: PAS domain-containing protein [Desulfobulbaceae bacterium]|nr:PAS domain-containing protein [Desulfobulbaceae bacterium]
MNDQKNVKPKHDLPAMLAEMAEIKARSEAIIAVIDEPLVIIDKTYKITYQNDIAQELWGDNIGNFCYETALNKIASCRECAVTRAWETGAVVKFEKSMPLPRGAKAVEIIASPIRDEKGRITGAIQIIRDISQFKQKARELEKALAQVRKLSAVLPICSHCKDIRNAEGTWLKLEAYFLKHFEVSFSHGICANCMNKHFPELAQD